MQYTNIRQFGNNIYYIGYEDGQRVQYKESITPTLYTKSPEPTNYKSLSGDFVVPRSFNTVKEAKDFVKDYEYVTDFTVYGYEKFHYVYLADKFTEDIKFDTELIRKFYLDIETSTDYGFPDVNDPKEKILCITLYDSYTKIYNVFGLADIDFTEPDTTYHYYDNEIDMLYQFVYYWCNNYPDIITNWNGTKFDIPYIVSRINLILGESVTKKLSPWGMIHTKKEYDFGNEYTVYDIVGVSNLDYLTLYKKFTYTNQENYKLDTIANVELGLEKLDHSEYATFTEFYDKAKYKFLLYNKHDVDLLLHLESKMKLIELAIVVAYDAKINFFDVYSQVTCWDNIIYNYLKKLNIAVPTKAYNSKDDMFSGAFVKEPTPGIYDWVVSFDLASLYPHIIQAWNISPETKRSKVSAVNVESVLAEELDLDELSDYCVSPSGTLYDRHNEGMLSKLMSKYYADRKYYKKLQLQAEQEYINKPTPELVSKISTYKNIQMAKKIAMNSAYGVLGCPFFRYYDLDNANSITHSGQVSIRWVSDRINKFIGNYLNNNRDRIITNDTDSLFLDLNDIVKKYCVGMSEIEIVDYLDNFSATILTDEIKDIYQKLGDYLHFHKHCLSMVRDVISSRFLITAKKRYIANVWDAEGVRYSTPKMKVVGLEVVRSSTPKFFRDKLKQAYSIILTQDNDALIKFIETASAESKKLNSAEVGITRGVSDVNKYTDYSGNYIKGCPIGARSAIIYNQFIIKNNLQHKYELIKNGDKIKTVYLKLPNPLHEDSVAFFDKIPPEMSLEKYVNFDLQIEKCFMKPLESVLDVIGWKIATQNTLEDLLFG
jgi:DNA polymerase elongation subunit (family B)